METATALSLSRFLFAALCPLLALRGCWGRTKPVGWPHASWESQDVHLVQANHQPLLFLTGDERNIAGEIWTKLLSCTAKIPSHLGAAAVSTGGDKNPCWRGLCFSALEALDILRECPMHLDGYSWLKGEVKRIIPGGNRSPSLGSSTPEDIQLLGL